MSYKPGTVVIASMDIIQSALDDGPSVTMAHRGDELVLNESLDGSDLWICTHRKTGIDVVVAEAEFHV